TSTIKGGVLCPIEVTFAINPYVIAIAKLIRVTKTIDVLVPCPVFRDVSFTIHFRVSVPVNGDVSVAIHRNLTSRAKLLFPLSVPLTHPFVTGQVSLANCSWSRGRGIDCRPGCFSSRH